MFDTKRYFDDCVRAIQESVRFDSSQAAPLPGMPFGKGAAEALGALPRLGRAPRLCRKKLRQLHRRSRLRQRPRPCRALPLRRGPRRRGLDAPALWRRHRRRRLYGRGTMDDKGPAIVCLYCMKALKDAGFAPRRTVKLIVGCNEENGWECIGHYNRCARMPAGGVFAGRGLPRHLCGKGHPSLFHALPLCGRALYRLRSGRAPQHGVQPRRRPLPSL